MEFLKDLYHDIISNKEITSIKEDNDYCKDREDYEIKI